MLTGHRHARWRRGAAADGWRKRRTLGHHGGRRQEGVRDALPVLRVLLASSWEGGHRGGRSKSGGGGGTGLKRVRSSPRYPHGVPCSGTVASWSQHFVFLQHGRPQRGIMLGTSAGSRPGHLLHVIATPRNANACKNFLAARASGSLAPSFALDLAYRTCYLLWIWATISACRCPGSATHPAAHGARHWSFCPADSSSVPASLRGLCWPQGQGACA